MTSSCTILRRPPASATATGPSSTTVRRRPPTPPQLDQNISDSRAPNAPTPSRMKPTVLTLNPDVVTCTANASTAPTAIRNRLTPRPMGGLLSVGTAGGSRSAGPITESDGGDAQETRVEARRLRLRV